MSVWREEEDRGRSFGSAAAEVRADHLNRLDHKQVRSIPVHQVQWESPSRANAVWLLASLTSGCCLFIDLLSGSTAVCTEKRVFPESPEKEKKNK